MPIFLACMLAATGFAFFYYLMSMFMIWFKPSAKIDFYFVSLNTNAIVLSFLNAGNNVISAFVLNYILHIIIIALCSSEASTVWFNILFTGASSTAYIGYTIFYIAASSAIVLTLYSLLIVVYLNSYSLLQMEEDSFSTITDFSVLVFTIREFLQRIIWQAEIKLCGKRSGSLFQECSYTDKAYEISIENTLQIIVVFSGLLLQESISLRICAAYLKSKKWLWYLILFFLRCCLLAEVAVVVFLFTDQTLLDEKFRIASYTSAIFVAICVLLDLARVAAYSKTEIQKPTPKSTETSKQLYLPMFSNLKISKENKPKDGARLKYNALRSKHD